MHILKYFQSINVLEGLLLAKEEPGVSATSRLHRLFNFAIMWSLGALLELDCRDKLEAFIRAHDNKLDLPKIPRGSNQTMYEFYVNDRGKKKSQYCFLNCHFKTVTPFVFIIQSCELRFFDSVVPAHLWM